MNWFSLTQVVLGQAEQNGASVFKLVGDAGPVVKLVLVILVLFSVISWAIIFMKWLLLRRAHQESEIFLKIFWESRQLDDIYRSSKDLIHSPLAEVFAAAYDEIKRFQKKKDDFSDARPDDSPRPSNAVVRDNVTRAMIRTTREQLTKMEKAVPFLATVGNTAPFIGLFGTVWGIMDSFQNIGLKGQASLAVVAPGISEALVATAVGLFAAIPAVVAFNYFAARLRSLEGSIDSFSSEFTNILERHLFR